MAGMNEETKEALKQFKEAGIETQKDLLNLKYECLTLLQIREIKILQQERQMPRYCACTGVLWAMALFCSSFLLERTLPNIICVIAAVIALPVYALARYLWLAKGKAYIRDQHMLETILAVARSGMLRGDDGTGSEYDFTLKTADRIKARAEYFQKIAQKEWDA